jgi:nicotinamidase-related amidase
MQFNKNDTALVVIDPQNDVLSEKGVSWGLVGASVKENNTVENLARLFDRAPRQYHEIGVPEQTDS